MIKMKFVPLKKQSKKAQRAYHLRSRKDWGEIRPVTRVVKSAKTYSRSREQELLRKERSTTE